MILILQQHLEAIGALCRKHGVRRLDVFGSGGVDSEDDSNGTDQAFDPATSDLDFLVEFDATVKGSLADRYFGLRSDLAELLGHKVDLVMADAVENPYFQADVDRTRQLIYAA